MLNIDDRLLDQTTSDELFLMLHISRYMNASDFKAFPSLATLCKKTGFSKPHVIKVKNACIEKGLLSCEKMVRENNGFASNEYTIETDYINLFINAKGRKAIEENEGGSKRRLQGVVNDVYKGGKQNLQGVVNSVYPNLLGTLPKLVNEQISETHTPEIFEIQDKEKATEPQAAPQPYLNANAPKTYKSHLEIYNTLVAFWKANPEYTETINLMIEPLGMGSQFPNKRKAFFDHVENIFCTSIKKNQKTPLSAFELHDIIVQKIAYGKAELSELKPLGGKEEAKEKKMAEIKNKPFISEEEESIIVAYCQERTGYSYTTSKEFRECQDLKAQRIYLQAKSNIENTKKYLISKNLIAA